MSGNLRSRIRVRHNPKPIPMPQFDWDAWIDGNEELGTWHGATEAEARYEILEWIEEREAEEFRLMLTDQHFEALREADTVGPIPLHVRGLLNDARMCLVSIAAILESREPKTLVSARNIAEARTINERIKGLMS